MRAESFFICTHLANDHQTGKFDISGGIRKIFRNKIGLESYYERP